MPGVTEGLAALIARDPPERALEVGCGTGHWLSLLAAYGAWVVGLDLSLAMLAATPPSSSASRLLCADADRPGLVAGSFDLILCVNSLHNFREPGRFVDHCSRWLRPGGTLSLVTLDSRPERLERYIYDFFPGTRERDLVRHPGPEQIQDWLLGAGFERVEIVTIERVEERVSGREVLSDYFLERDSNSTLALLSEAEYGSGIERLRRHLVEAETAGETPEFTTHMELLMINGRVGGTVRTPC